MPLMIRTKKFVCKNKHSLVYCIRWNSNFTEHDGINVNTILISIKVEENHSTMFGTVELSRVHNIPNWRKISPFMFEVGICCWQSGMEVTYFNGLTAPKDKQTIKKLFVQQKLPFRFTNSWWFQPEREDTGVGHWKWSSHCSANLL